MRRFMHVVKQLMAVVGPKRDKPVRIACIAAPFLLGLQNIDHSDHVHVATQMLTSLGGAVA